jgi:uncharacterized oligopeptide transporter (OPT) family protein
LPWILVAIGVGIALLCEALKVNSLAFAVGVYLPLSTFTPLFLGGLLRWIMERRAKSKEEKNSRRERGVLLGSGLVGGEGLMGVAIAGVAFYQGTAPSGIGTAWAADWAPLVGLLAFAGLVWAMWKYSLGK